MRAERMIPSHRVTQERNNPSVNSRLRYTETSVARVVKQILILVCLAAMVLCVASSFTRKSEAADSFANLAPAFQTASSDLQGKKFSHTTHNQIKCDQCHVRKADAIVPVMPGHRACIACHIKAFTSTQFGICSNCHQGITAVLPPVVDFPERQSFGVEFSHKTHATYQAG